MRTSIGSSTVIAALALTTAACAPRFTEFSEINASKLGHVQKVFAPQDIAPDVAAKFPKAANANADFKSMVIRVRSDYVATAGKTENRVVVQTFENAGNGLIQEMSEFAANDIPYRLYFALTYGGIVPAKTQIANHRDKYANVPVVTEEIEEVTGDLLALKENDPFSAKWITRAAYPNAQKHKQSIQCKAGQTFAATTLSPNLKGDAQYLNCDRYVNDILGLKIKFALLKKYGVAVTLESKASNYTVTDTITEATVN